ncbi:redoxin domain-containing protein [Spongiactinospora gelatinilytica]|uniref:redoxin domain-containing protein n=1 Tax=Spongiactinospora gelatinilytica TaxID=2666298 RepID=UPI0011B93F15|nr:redoxin domain-containing protein [Spongiactinospora gelatinilytica]
MTRIRVTATIVAAGVLAAACGASDEMGRSDAPASATVGRASPAPAPTHSGRTPVPETLRFTATTLGGQRFDGASLAGKAVVFWFWAPWCPKCRSEAPAVKTAAAKYTDVAFVGVAGLDGEAAMREFVRRTGTGGFPHLSDEKGAVWTRLGVSQQSTFVFMKADGSTERVSGPLGPDDLDRHVAKLRSS